MVHEGVGVVQDGAVDVLVLGVHRIGRLDPKVRYHVVLRDVLQIHDFS